MKLTSKFLWIYLRIKLNYRLSSHLVLFLSTLQSPDCKRFYTSFLRSLNLRVKRTLPGTVSVTAVVLITWNVIRKQLYLKPEICTDICIRKCCLVSHPLCPPLFSSPQNNQKKVSFDTS